MASRIAPSPRATAVPRHFLVLAPTAGLRPHGGGQVKLCFGHAGNLADALAGTGQGAE